MYNVKLSILQDRYEKLYLLGISLTIYLLEFVFSSENYIGIGTACSDKQSNYLLLQGLLSTTNSITARSIN